MKERPQETWKQRLEAWTDRPPSLEPEEARRRVLRRIEARTPTRWAASRWIPRGRRLLVLATATVATIGLAIALRFATESTPVPPPMDTARHSTLVLELPSGSTLYLTTQENSK